MQTTMVPALPPVLGETVCLCRGQVACSEEFDLSIRVLDVHSGTEDSME